MPIQWKLYRFVCFLQTALAAFILFTSIVNFFRNPSFSDVARLLLFLLIMLLAIFAINLLNNNYPDTPVEGSQKKAFNRLFLLNFLFLAFLFGFIFAEYRVLRQFSELTHEPILSLPFELLIGIISYLLALVFQLIILYGLYILRRLLYDNFTKKKFDFEA